jgi:tetratricopeptide (TPR) repeat protein
MTSQIEVFLANQEDMEDRLELSRLLFQAIQLSGQRRALQFAVGLASDLIHIATQSYYDENYDAVIEYGDKAIATRPNNVDVRRVVAQALIRRERWDEAQRHIDYMITIGAMKEAFYVKGFLERRRKHNNEAIEAYKRAIEYGRGGVAVHRELAQCYFQVGMLDKARTHIGLAEEASPHNRFVVDLKCTIATKLGEVTRCLQLLEKIDTGGFAYHRRSRFELSEGRPEDALKYARLANERTFRPSFEIPPLS